MSSGGLIFGLLPHFSPPPWLRLRFDGSVAITLTGACMAAVVMDSRGWRLVIGTLVAGFGSYNLGHGILAGAEDSGHSWLTGHQRLPVVPAALIALVGVCCLAGVKSVRRRLLWRTVAVLSLVTGLLAIVAYLGPTRVLVDWLRDQLLPMGAIFAVILAVSLWGIAAQRSHPILDLPRSAVAVGILGVVLSMLWWFLGSWEQYQERLRAAEVQVSNFAAAVEHELDSQVGMIRRIAGRWQIPEGEGVPDKALRKQELASYFDDSPALLGFAFRSEEGQSLWLVGRSSQAQRWLEEELAGAAGEAWLRDLENHTHTTAWRFPDPDRKQLALVAIRPEPGVGHYLLAVLDIEVLVSNQAPQDAGEFDLALRWPADRADVIPEGGDQLPHGPAVLATAVVELAEGPGLQLLARSGPPEFAKLSNLMPIGGGLFGLLFTYQLIIGRALLHRLNGQTRALRTSEQRFRSLFSQNPDAVFALDREGGCDSLNPLSQEILGLSEDDVRGVKMKTVLARFSLERADLRVSQEAYQDALQGRPRSFSLRYRWEMGGTRNFEISLLPIVVDDQVEGVFGIAKDVTQRLAAEEHMRILERSLEASSNAVIVADAREPGFPVIYVNPAFTRITEYAAASVLGEEAKVFLTGRYVNAEDSARIIGALEGRHALSLTLRNRRRDGSPFWNQLALAPVRDSKGVTTHFVGVLNDISERKEQENRLAYQATHDALTGLANRALFNDRLEHDFALARRRRQVLAVLFIDLDEFKPINDTLGHKVGDELLVSVTGRLADTLRPSDTLARLGGDEFVLLLPDLRQSHQAEEVAERLLLELARPHQVAGHELYISASIGIAVITDDMLDPEKLIQHSDMAMYQAKQQGRNTYQLFTADMDATLSRRVSLRNELQEALDANQLELYYQPVLDISGRMAGMEALVRWFHPVEGAIPPSVFIPIAEETGQIVQLSRWVMERACRDAVALQQQGLLRGKLAVNLSPMQFHRPSFMSTLKGILRDSGLDAAYLELELTEGILMRDTDRAIDILHELAAMGIATAIDDFGTGFSSLSYIRTLPVGKIKLDGSFVRGVIENRKDAAVCKGIIAMARELQLRVVAEGVETRAQFEYLKSHGCEMFQGFLFAHPMSLAAVSVWLREQADTQATS